MRIMGYVTDYASPLGRVFISSDGTCLTGLWFEGQKHQPPVLEEELTKCDIDVFRLAKAWLDVYFSGREPEMRIPLLTEGTEFQKRVWKALEPVPYGKTVTYGEIAWMLASENRKGKVSARAVGGAVGRNRIALILPCHRVIGADGSLTGYAGGIWRKKELLSLEGIDLI